MPRPRPSLAPSIRAGDVGDDHAREVVVLDDPEVGHQGGERVGRDLGPGCRDLGDEGGLARRRQAEQPHVGQDLELEAQLLLLARKAGFGVARGAVDRGLEVQVAASAVAALADDDLGAVLHQVGDQLLADGPVLFLDDLEDERAHGQVDDQVVRGLAVAVAAHAGLAVLGPVVALEAEVVQRHQPAGAAKDHVAALAAVAAVRAALGQVGLGAAGLRSRCRPCRTPP